MGNSNNTVCKDCCFAEWDDITQVGCSRNMISKYRKVGSTVLECYDNEKEFYVIKDRFCPFKRSQRWMETYQHLDINDILKMETRFEFHFVIWAMNDINKLHSILSDIPYDTNPIRITVVKDKNNTLNNKELYNMLSSLHIPSNRVTLEVQLHDQPVEGMIHKINKSSKSQYCVLMNEPYIIQPNILDIINEFVIDHVRQFAVILPCQNNSCTIIPKHVYTYWYFNGDPKLSIVDNILLWEKNNNEKVTYKMLEIEALIS